MKSRGFLALALLVSGWIGLASVAYEGAEQAIQAFLKGNLSKEDLDTAGRDIEAAALREPSNNRWQFGRALLLEKRDQKIEARDLMEKVVEREPKSAEYQCWFGGMIFEAINETGMLTKLSWANKGKAALEKAVELDPHYVQAHSGLIQFYSNAPAIAGGSVAKAEQHAKALIAIPDGRGEYRGRMALVQLAANRKDWAEMDRQFTLAESAKGEGANPAATMTRHALALLQQADDPAKALPVAERLAKIAKPDDMTAVYVIGECQRKLGNCKSAIAQFEKVLASKPEAQNSRFGAAACYEQLGERAKAATYYEEFARRFPKDDRAAEATTAARKLRKRASRDRRRSSR